MTRPAAVAIVGMAIRLPGAEADLTRFWQAVVDGKDCSREVPPGRWILPPEACYDPRPGQPDRVYCRRGYYLDPFVPNLNGLNVDPTWVAQLDPLVQLVLDVGNRAWASARLEQIDRRRVGVVLGNICLPTEHSSALCQALLGPAWGLPPVNAVHPDNRRVAGFPAALLAQALRLGRGGYSLDAACASSLYALYLAVRELQSGRADAMLAGGCCRPDCLYTQMGFAQLRALSSSGRCAPFDAAADGLLVGEGAALFVLKRLQDAIRHGDHIYAVITGIGLSNDRAGNLLAPSSEGQLRAMQRAYQQAGCLPQEVDYIECHATGTPIGDAVEFASLRQLWGNAGWQIGQCVLSSVKATVGHLLTGAGAAALAKVLLALQYRQLPPQANFVRPAPQLAYEGSPFRILTQAQPWDQPRHRPRRAALSAFGFGGINAHLILEEWTSQLALVHTPPRRAVPVAIVGLACRFGPYRNQQQLRDALHGNVVRPPQPKQRGWESAPRPCPSAWAIDHLEFPTGRFRIPPRELEETLPQQLLMLNLADQAVEDSRRATLPNHTFVSPLAPNSARQFSPEHTSTRASPSTQPAHPFILLTTETSKESGHNQTDVGPTKSLSSSPLGVQPPTPLPPAPSMASPLPMELGLRTGVFIGLELDANTMNFHLRWTALAHGRPDDAERISPPLNANRTIGALGSIAASRIARALGVGGPSFVVCNEEASALRAVSLAVQALQDEEIDLAIAGAVDLAADPRCVLPARIDRPGEGGAAFVLKRLTDAQRDGDTIYAIIRGSGSGSDAFAALNDACQQAEGDRAFPPPLPSSLTVSVVGACGAAQAAADLVAAILSFQSSNINPALKADAAGALLASSLPNPAAPRRYSLTAASCTTHLTLLLEEATPSTALSTHSVCPATPAANLTETGTLGHAPVGTTATSNENQPARTASDHSGQNGVRSLAAGTSLPVDGATVSSSPLPFESHDPQVSLLSLLAAQERIHSRLCDAQAAFLRVQQRWSGIATRLLQNQQDILFRYLMDSAPSALCGPYSSIASAASDTWPQPSKAAARPDQQSKSLHSITAALQTKTSPSTGTHTIVENETTIKASDRRPTLAAVPLATSSSDRDGKRSDLQPPWTGNIAASNSAVDTNGAEPSPRLIPSPVSTQAAQFPASVPQPPRSEGGGSTQQVVERPSSAHARQQVPRSLSYEQCCTFAAGRIADVLGPMYAVIDTYPTRVRLPDGPLQLVDRIVHIEGEPLSLRAGRVITEHTVHAQRWYLEAERMPTALSVEAGQADLFLSGFLGIDLQTKGQAVYRLLDAVVTFHRGLPRVGETIRYDITIDEFVQQGGVWLFRFRFDGTIGGQPYITMRHGTAGFFTPAALAAGKGIVQTALDRQPRAGKRPDDWRELAPLSPTSLNERQLAALRQGDLATAFGPAFGELPLERPRTLPDGPLRLLDRVPIIDLHGGRFGLGLVRGELDIHPDDWFLTCHFVDDPVMPGTLMYECCLQTLRVGLLRLGWLGEGDQIAYEPVPGVASRLKCRGQVIATTRTTAYEVTIKELGYRPQPYCLADALMFADGKPIVEITNLSLQVTGLERATVEQLWHHRRQRSVVPTGPAGLHSAARTDNSSRSATASLLDNDNQSKANPTTAPEISSTRAITTVETAMPDATGNDFPTSVLAGDQPLRFLYDSRHILAFSNGKPSEAFGEPYRIFDEQRVIARLPGPPYQFLDGITAVGGPPFVLQAGAWCEAVYTIPPDAWYFDEYRCGQMPYCVLLEVALQPCGWLAAYCGSALHSEDDLCFRNLGGSAVQYRPVTRTSGRLITHTRLTQVAKAAGMIIEHFSFQVADNQGPVYAGSTYFGFFTRQALQQQVGLREGHLPPVIPVSTADHPPRPYPSEPPFAGPRLRMVDQLVTYDPQGGRAKLGWIVGSSTVDPAAWFFRAHFYQDPVWPGSLGLQALLQLLQYTAFQRWGCGTADSTVPSYPPLGQAPALNIRHEWTYRGQVVPDHRQVIVQAEITAVDDRQRRLIADGWLSVDERPIYHMRQFSLQLT